MKVYVITGHAIDKTNHLENLFEPETYVNLENAEIAANDMVQDELSNYSQGDIFKNDMQHVGSNGFDRDFEISSADRLFELKLREVDLSDDEEEENEIE